MTARVITSLSSRTSTPRAAVCTSCNATASFAIVPSGRLSVCPAHLLFFFFFHLYILPSSVHILPLPSPLTFGHYYLPSYISLPQSQSLTTTPTNEVPPDPPEDWLIHKAPHKVWLRNLQVYSFCDEYRPHRQRRGRFGHFQIRFAHATATTRFRQLFNPIPEPSVEDASEDRDRERLDGRDRGRSRDRGSESDSDDGEGYTSSEE